MIDNVVSLIQGALNNKEPDELLSHADPMGWTNEMRALLTVDASAGYEELYRTVLIDTPVSHYFEEYLNQQDANHADRDVGGVRTVTDAEEAFSELDLGKWLHTLGDISSCRGYARVSEESLAGRFSCVLRGNRWNHGVNHGGYFETPGGLSSPRCNFELTSRPDGWGIHAHRQKFSVPLVRLPVSRRN